MMCYISKKPLSDECVHPLLTLLSISSTAYEVSSDNHIAELAEEFEAGAGNYLRRRLLHAAHATECYDLSSIMTRNELQYFSGMVDDQANGMATCKLCTNGYMRCDATVFGGVSTLIASHIHLAEDGDGKNGSGKPVINFCGKNTKGYITGAGHYPEECAMYQDSVSQNKGMVGERSAGDPDKDLSDAERIRDIGENPGKYYFNFHSLQSWAHWYPNPKGMCRGQMISSHQPMEESFRVLEMERGLEEEEDGQM